MTLVRWRPRMDIPRIQDEMNRLFDDFFGRSEFPAPRREATWTPDVDIAETPEAVIVHAEVPGIKQEDVKISVQDNTLTIKGEKKQESEERDAACHRIERIYGAFQRSFALPVAVQTAKAKASYQNGVLKIVLPKAEEAKPREIAISVE